MSKFFGAVNEVDSHYKYSQSYFALKKFWVTQCGWLWLCTAFYMEMTITTLWKIFCYGVNRDHYEKLISMREFSEKLALDSFNNPFSTDNETPANNIPL